MKLTKVHWIGIIASIVILGLDMGFFWGESMFPFLLSIGLAVVVLPFLIGLIIESKVEQEKNERFLEFTRNLAESVKTGTPIGKSITNMSSKDFGSLSPHIKKLANQIGLGIPTSRALQTFAIDVDSVVIKRAISLIREAENAGGEIDYILDSTAESIYQIEKLKRERKAAVSSLVVQGYIIFLIFVGIMLIMQFKILPLTAGAQGIASGQTLEGTSLTGGTAVDPETLARPFLYLLLVQGFFTGLTIGKLSEGTLRGGLKHSLIMVLAAFLITSGANAFIGVPSV
ncbi:MAG: type II secretion system F family protein [Nanoarchaeota archaeon]